MLSTRLTGSSTSITIVSSRSARSIPVSAPALREVLGDETLAGIARRDVARGEKRGKAGVVAVEEGGPVFGDRTLEGGGRRCAHRRVPVVAGEHLVGALTRLHDLHVARDFLAEQIEGDTVVADHRFAHRPDRAVQSGQHPFGADADLVMIGVEAFGHDVGVLEFIALHSAGRLEADGERRQPVLTGLGEQADDQAGIHPAGKQATDRDVGDESALDGGPQRAKARRLPSRVRTSRSGRRAC